MGNYLIGCSLLLVLILPVRRGYGQEWEKKWKISLSTGYQQENLRWSIAGNRNGQDPNIYSELKWKGVGGPCISAALQGDVGKGVSFFAGGSRAFIITGSAYDTDYQGDNRTNASYRENFSANRGSVGTWSVGAGYLILHKKRFRLTPYIGYGMNYQSYFLIDPGAGPSLLHSSYKTCWSGPLLKINSRLLLNDRLQLEADMEYHQVQYSARADWNLITAFSHPLSFRHAARGYGIDAHVRLEIRLCHAISLHIGGGYFNWQTGTGTDELYLASGQTELTQLNEVIRDGFQWLAGIQLPL